jgi:hypothetical protein
LIGEDVQRYYCLAESRYHNSPAMHLAEQYCKERKIVAADHNAISQLGFNLDAQRLEEYGAVAREQKDEMADKVVSALLDQSLDAAEAGLGSAKSLNPWNVNQAVKMLEEKGFAHPAIVAALRRVAQQRYKPEMFEAYKHFIDLAKAAREGWKTGEAAEKDPKNSNALLLLAALKTVQKNPEMGLIITGAEFTESMAYLYYLSGQIPDIAQSTDEKLARLPALSQRLHSHARELAETRRAWREQTSYSGATPVCPPN